MDSSHIIRLLFVLISSTNAEGNSVSKVTNIGNDTTLEALDTAPHVLLYSLSWLVYFTNDYAKHHERMISCTSKFVVSYQRILVSIFF